MSQDFSHLRLNLDAIPYRLLSETVPRIAELLFLLFPCQKIVLKTFSNSIRLVSLFESIKKCTSLIAVFSED